ncbi:MAG: NAD(P)H-dependent glycerol-3-phosphate dehydrogenase [Burkholderiales bacterium]
MTRIGIIGAGAYGTALACVVRRSGNEVVIWAREPEVAAAINCGAENTRFLKGITLPPGIIATTDLSQAAAADVLLLAPPAQHMRAVTTQLRPHLTDGKPVVSCSKGIERGTCALMSQVIAETLPCARIAVLSGPSFATDIAIDLPAGVTLACADVALGERLAQMIGTPRFRTYLSSDVIGAHVGGVLKNVMAIACGVSLGKQFGDSARATLIARGLAEAARLGVAMGARFESFLGLCGVGDFILSCNSPRSRNMSLGVALGEGRQLADILAERITVQEGVHSAESVAALARRFRIDMPIALGVDAVLNHGANVDETINKLLSHACGMELPFQSTSA